MRWSTPSARWRDASRLIVATAVLATLVTVACWPVTTAVGFNYRVTVHRLTLFEKAMSFVNRDLEMRRLTREVVGSEPDPERRLLRMFEWVTENIHSVPPGMPIIDDHVFHIFVRRYGAPDQRAEALAALASYDGIPASQVALGKDPKRQLVQLTAVKLNDRIVVLDTNNRIIFRTSSGALATVDDLIADPSIVRKAGEGIVVDGTPYHEHFRRLRDAVPNFLRMERQRFWPRLRDETVKLLTGR